MIDQAITNNTTFTTTGRLTTHQKYRPPSPPDAPSTAGAGNGLAAVWTGRCAGDTALTGNPTGPARTD
jgi:hypothetical protein